MFLFSIENRVKIWLREKAKSSIFFKHLNRILLRPYRIIYASKLRFETMLFNLDARIRRRKRNIKCLYASAVGNEGKAFLAKIIEKFGCEDFDYLIFVYDNTEFKETIFKKCSFIYEKGFKYYFFKKYITPSYCAQYDYIFLWDDDIDIENFSPSNFIDIMKRNNLQIAQPALTSESYYAVPLTLKNEKYNIGRYVDYVEVMCPVFMRDAWRRIYEIIDEKYPLGRGYDLAWKSVCRLKNLGIIDCEAVRHSRPVRNKHYGVKEVVYKYPYFRWPKMVSYADLK